MKKNPGPSKAPPRSKNPVRELREDHYKVSQADMCQALRVSPTLLAATEKGTYKRVPPAILAGLKALGHDPDRITEAYARSYEEACEDRFAQLQQSGH